jgi:hypothetical protein
MSRPPASIIWTTSTRFRNEAGRRYGARMAVVIAATVSLLGPLSHASAQNADPESSVRFPPLGELEVVGVPSPLPDLVIGEGVDAVHVFLSVADAARLDDGNIVVLGSSSLRVFSPGGLLLRSFGRSGEGPGEFAKPISLQIGPGDSLYVFDSGHQRLSVFSPAGELLRDARIQEAISPTHEIGRFTDGTWFARGADRVMAARPGDMARDTVTFALLTDRMTWGRRLARVPGVYTSSVSIGGRQGARQTPFSPEPISDHHGRCLYLASGESPQVTVLEATGHLVRTLQSNDPSRAASPGDWDRWVDYMSEPVPADRRGEYRRVVDRIPRMERLPVFHDLVVDRQGYIWMQHYAAPFGEGTDFTILASTGEAVGRVEFPEALKILEIGVDYVLGRRMSGLNEEVLVMYGLTRSDSLSETIPDLSCK